MNSHRNGNNSKNEKKFDPETTAKLNRRGGRFSCTYSACRPKEEKPMDTPKKRKREKYWNEVLDAVKKKYLLILKKIVNGEEAPFEMIKDLKRIMADGTLAINGKGTVNLPPKFRKDINMIYQDITEKMLDKGYIDELAQLGEDDLLANGAVCHKNELVALEAARIIVSYYPGKKEDVLFLFTSNHEEVRKLAVDTLTSVANNHDDTEVAVKAAEELVSTMVKTKTYSKRKAGILLESKHEEVRKIAENVIENLKY